MYAIQAKQEFINRINDLIAGFGGLRQQYLAQIGAVVLEGFSLSYDALSYDEVIRIGFLKPGENVRDRKNRPDAVMTWLGGTEWELSFEGSNSRSLGGEIAYQLAQQLKAMKDALIPPAMD